MQVYLAARHSAAPDFNFPAIDAAAGFLTRFKGHEVFNQSARDRAEGFDPTGPDGREWADDDAWITAHAQAVCLMPGWEKSARVRGQLALAAALGLLAGTMYEFGTDTLRAAVDVLADLHAADKLAADAAAAAAAQASEALALAPAPVAVAVAFAPAAADLTMPLVPAPPFSDPPTQATATSGEVRVTSITGASKGQKLARHDLVPTGPLAELAEHYGRGAVKYARVNGLDNWRNGYDWSLSYAAMQRHAHAFWGGQDIDEETGSKHLVAVAWHAFSLIEFMNTPAFVDQFDDRQDRARAGGPARPQAAAA